MTARTKEQQIEYNAKRRRENATIKAGKLIGTAPGPKVKSMGSLGKVPPIPKHDLAAQIETLGPDSLLSDRDRAAMTRKAKGKRKSVATPAAPVAAKVPVKRTVRGKGGDTSLDPALHKSKAKPLAPKKLFEAKVGPKVVQRVAVVKSKPLTVPEGMAPVPTMERSYVRNGAAGKGMKRGNTYQSTVTFTKSQLMELRDKAQFNNRSLAEQIRWCVVQQLKTT